MSLASTGGSFDEAAKPRISMKQEGIQSAYQLFSFWYLNLAWTGIFSKYNYKVANHFSPTE